MVPPLRIGGPCTWSYLEGGVERGQRRLSAAPLSRMARRIPNAEEAQTPEHPERGSIPSASSCRNSESGCAAGPSASVGDGGAPSPHNSQGLSARPGQMQCAHRRASRREAASSDSDRARTAASLWVTRRGGCLTHHRSGDAPGHMFANHREMVLCLQTADSGRQETSNNDAGPGGMPFLGPRGRRWAAWTRGSACGACEPGCLQRRQQASYRRGEAHVHALRFCIACLRPPAPAVCGSERGTVARRATAGRWVSSAFASSHKLAAAIGGTTTRTRTCPHAPAHAALKPGLGHLSWAAGRALAPAAQT